MKKIALCVGLFACLLLAGCDNLSPRDNMNPRLQQDIQGKINRLENNQNSIKSEIDRLALVNKENRNNGIQILQGEDGLFLVFGLVVVFLTIYYFYKIAEGERRTSEILAEQIVRRQDNALESEVLKAAEYTDVEEKIGRLISNKKLKLLTPKEES